MREAASGTPRPRHSKVVPAPVQPRRHDRHPGVPALGVCLFVVLLPAGTISARYGNPATPGAISRGTVPPSSYRSALVNSPDPVDNTSSLAVTGNAAGGKSFRGNIPYGSTTSFGGPLGSTSLDPFLRYSAMPEEPSRGSSAWGSFYSPTATVPKMEAGSTGLFAPGSPRIAAGVLQSQADQRVNMMLAPEIPSSPGLTGRSFTDGRPATGAWLSPSARTSEEMRRIVVGEPDASPADHGPGRQTRQLMTAQEYQQQVEQLQRDLDGVKARAFDFERDLNAGRQPSITEGLTPRSAEMPLPPVSAETLRRIIWPESPAPALASETNPSAGQDLSFSPAPSIPARPAAPGPGELTLISPGSSLAGPRTEALPPFRPGPYSPSTNLTPSPSELTEQRKRIDAIFAPQTGTPGAPKSSESANQLPAMQRVDDIMRPFDAPARIREQPQQTSPGNILSSTQGSDRTAPAPDDLQALPEKAPAPATTPPRSPEPVAPPAPLDPVAQGKLDAYLQLAGSEMQQGQYARAAESFAMAAIYNPRDARPQLGRSRALLAVGEYLGSAVCLAKAIELDPRLSLAESDLVQVVGGPDRFLQRINDLQERAKSNPAPGLQLLLAYIYYQMKAPDDAKTAIQAAKKALPASASVDLLDKAIRTIE